MPTTAAMTRLPSLRFPRAPKALAYSLVLAAVALAMTPLAPPGLELVESFESFPGPWLSLAADGGSIDFMPPSGEPLPSRRAVGAWDGSKALRVQYDGFSMAPSAEAIGAFQFTSDVYLRLMVYVPSATAQAMAAGDEVRIARVMPIATDPGASLVLALAKSAGVVYVLGGANQKLGDPIATDILPDTWHMVELAYTEDTFTNVCGVSLYVDDLSAPRANIPMRTTECVPSSGAVAVGLAAGGRVSAGQPLVYWLDDVKIGPFRGGVSSPLFHYQQDGYDGPNIAVGDDPAGKALVAVGNATDHVKWTANGHRGGEMVAEDFSAGPSWSAAYGELPLYDAGLGKLYHRVWWRQGPVTAAGNHPLVGISSDLLGAAPLGNPMAALSVGPDGGTFTLWGYSLLSGGVVQLDQPSTLSRALDAGWHLLELEVSASGTTGGRQAWVDGIPVGGSSATWIGVRPSRWIDGHLPDPTNSAYQGVDEYDDSRTSLSSQPSYFKVFLPAALDAGTCIAASIQAYDSTNAAAPPAEDVLLSYDSSGVGAFYRDSSCTQLVPAAGSLLVPSGQNAVPVYFRATVPGSALITLSAPDYLPHGTSFSINGMDMEPPTPPGQPGFMFNPIDQPVAVTWSGSTDDGGSGLAKYQVEASLNDGGWMLDHEVLSPVPGAISGYTFSRGEGYWKLRVRAFDVANNPSPYGPESQVLTMDLTAPNPPPLAPAAALTLDGGWLHVSWGLASDPGPVSSGVLVYAAHFTPTPPAPPITDCQEYATSCDVPVRPGNAYQIEIQTQDGAGNVGGYGPFTTWQYPGPAARLRLLGPTPGMDAGYAVVDDPYPVTVEVLDSNGNIATAYAGTIEFEALTTTGGTYPATAPLDGGTYQFQLTDQGRQSFDPGFIFNTPGTAIAKVKDAVNTTVLPDQVAVTVIARTDLRIVRDANPSAAIGVPYLYNAAGRVRVITADTPVTFSLCSGSVPNGFLLDSSSGAISWTPESGTNFPVTLCVQATASHGDVDTYPFTVNLLAATGNPPIAYFTATPNQANAGASVVFDSTPSYWEAGLGPPAYRWRFGDGSLLAFRGNPFREYQLPGGYRPSLTLFDGIGRSDQTSRQVLIADPAGRLPPSLAILSRPPLQRDLLTATLEAQPNAGAFPPGPVHWDLGNGEYAEGSDAGATYLPGRYWATATTVDQGGLAATDKVEIAVSRGDRVPPQCVASVDPTVATFTAASSGRARVDFVAWRAPGSRKIDSVTWTIDGTPTTAGEVTRFYTSAGWHHGVLTVRDEDGLTCTDSVSVLVLDGQAPKIPPRIVDPGVSGPIDCKKRYVGRPALATGQGPFSWRLVSTTPGNLPFTVDGGNGQMTWTPTALLGTPVVTYVLQVDSAAEGSDQLEVAIPYACADHANLDTRCGCGEGGGGPVAAGLALLSLWFAARRRSAARLGARSRRP